jgi:hypothetical protein
MSQAESRFTTTARIRFPKEFLAVVDEWAAAHDQPRSVAVRALILRGLALHDVRQCIEAGHAFTSKLAQLHAVQSAA